MSLEATQTTHPPALKQHNMNNKSWLEIKDPNKVSRLLGNNDEGVYHFITRKILSFQEVKWIRAMKVDWEEGLPGRRRRLLHSLLKYLE